ncbi:hypothetical protein K504DRAFT_460216 [Pleomassaria siparia CBS 279.74]|uniref:Uncharacterized protein n=1 Tax=Pleomassaria siparia CBS 279.74 TaxID=1314801 RepID=A0A6G1JXX8_9PLEO|nr:hypothetical protein K504DRAFT_460216 [Pleomassaria siparia CBS 279.74]
MFSEFDNFPATFDQLPEEILLELARNLQHDHTGRDVLTPIRAEGSPASKSQNILAFCRLNRRCGRIGQEVLYEHVDLGVNPVRQPALFLRTVFAVESRCLGVRTNSLAIKLRDTKPWHAPFLSAMYDVVQESALPDWAKCRWIGCLQTGLSIYIYLVMVLLLPNLNHLDVRGLDDITTRRLIKEVNEMQAVGILPCLNSLSLTGHIDDHVVLSLPEAFPHGIIKTLKVNPQVIGWFAQTTKGFHVKELTNAEAPYSPIETLTLGRYISVPLLGLLLAKLSVLRSLTLHYEISRWTSTYHNARLRDFWPRLVLVKDTLEHLRVTCRRGPLPLGNTPCEESAMGHLPNFTVWPQQIWQMHRLKVLEWDGAVEPSLAIRGGYSLIKSLSTSEDTRRITAEEFAKEFLPPNLETLRFVPDRIVTGDVARLNVKKMPGNKSSSVAPGQEIVSRRMDMADVLSQCLGEIPTLRPSLKSVTVSLSTWPAEVFHTLQQRLLMNGVQLLGRDTAEEREELWEQWGNYWGLDDAGPFFRQLKELDNDREEALERLRADSN